MDTRLASSNIKHLEAEVIQSLPLMNTIQARTCITCGQTTYLQYLHWPPAVSRHIDHASLDKNGSQQFIHVPVCDVCKLHFHGEVGATAHYQAINRSIHT